jgi:AraC-like DNA-binding protein
MENLLAEGFKGERAIVTPLNVRAYQANNEITKHLYLTHIGYYPNARFHYRKRNCGADENILIYCDRGAGWIEYEEKKHLLKANTYFILPAEKRHAYGADPADPWSIYWFHFRGDQVRLFDSIIGKSVSPDVSDIDRQHDRIRLFDEMYRNLDMGYGVENLEYISFCLTYYLASLKYVSQYGAMWKMKEHDVIRRSVIYMKEHLEDKISLSDISRAAGYSTSRLNVLFMQRTSYSPIEYYQQLKIRQACDYLQFSDLKIKEIAFRLQYYDPYHFSKSFSREMGLTPKAYRQRYKDTP